MAESEDRTQAPSKLRQQQARERGQVAHSPELTGAAALLAASLLMGVFGESIISGLHALIRDTWTGELPVSLDLSTTVARLRSSAFAVLGPLALVLLGLVAAGVAAHQAQVGGLWSPNLLAPNVGRLWGVGAGRGMAARAARGAWIIGKTVVILVVAVWAVRSRLDGLVRLGRIEVKSLAHIWADAIRGLLTTMATSALLLGVIDHAIQRVRFSAMLRLTPDEAREDRKATDGDPALRGRRRRIARAMRGDSPELLVGATLVVTGANGLTVVLGGGPPPKRVSVRSAANGPTGVALRRSAGSAHVPVVENPDLATKLARISSKPNIPLSADMTADLAGVWPVV